MRRSPSSQSLPGSLSFRLLQALNKALRRRLHGPYSSSATFSTSSDLTRPSVAPGTAHRFASRMTSCTIRDFTRHARGLDFISFAGYSTSVPTPSIAPLSPASSRSPRALGFLADLLLTARLLLLPLPIRAAVATVVAGLRPPRCAGADLGAALSSRGMRAMRPRVAAATRPARRVSVMRVGVGRE